MKEESEGLKMEGMNEKESDIENRLNDEDLTRKEPVNEGNNEGEIIPEESKLEILIENDLEIGKH